jgi:hypothetical protein
MAWGTVLGAARVEVVTKLKKEKVIAMTVATLMNFSKQLSQRVLRTFLEHAPVSSLKPSLFDEDEGRWTIDSLEGAIIKERANTAAPLSRPDYCSIGLASGADIPPAAMGGPNDPAASRAEVTFDFLRGTAVALAALKRGLVELSCMSCSGRVQWTDLRNTEDGQCSLCGIYGSQDLRQGRAGPWPVSFAARPV